MWKKFNELSTWNYMRKCKWMKMCCSHKFVYSCIMHHGSIWKCQLLFRNLYSHVMLRGVRCDMRWHEPPLLKWNELHSSGFIYLSAKSLPKWKLTNSSTSSTKKRLFGNEMKHNIQPSQPRLKWNELVANLWLVMSSPKLALWARVTLCKPSQADPQMNRRWSGHPKWCGLNLNWKWTQSEPRWTWNGGKWATKRSKNKINNYKLTNVSSSRPNKQLYRLFYF